MASDVTRFNIQTIMAWPSLNSSTIEFLTKQPFRLLANKCIAWWMIMEQVVLDFESVEHLSSAALGKLINMKKKMDAAGGQLAMYGLRSELLKIFKVTKLTKVLTFPSVEKANQVGPYHRGWSSGLMRPLPLVTDFQNTQPSAYLLRVRICKGNYVRNHDLQSDLC